jgi:hypothetical protein
MGRSIHSKDHLPERVPVNTSPGDLLAQQLHDTEPFDTFGLGSPNFEIICLKSPLKTDDYRTTRNRTP